MKENQGYENFIVGQLKKDFLRCFWPVERCRNNAVRAHSIQNSRVLDQLSEKGHLIAPRTKMDFKNGPKVSFRNVGRNEVSTFTGLCSKHDLELFRIIDTQEIDWQNDEHLFLLAYRSVLRELHSKMRAANDLQTVYSKYCKDGMLNPNDPNLPFWDATIAMLESYSTYRYKFRFDQIYIHKKYPFIKHDHILANVSEPSIAVSSSFDCFNNLVKYEDRMDPKLITLNIYPEGNITHIIFSYRIDHEIVLRPFIDPILCATGSHQLYLISKLVLRHCENFVISPKYFRSLEQTKINSMIDYFTKNIFSNKTDYDNPDLFLFNVSK
jgi:hypothetical protein